MASPNRLITLDTETTGLDAQNGDRIIEIGCVAIEGRMMRSTGEHHLQIFVNPEREVPEEAVAIHGITTEYLQDKPKFAEIADKFIDFVKGSTLVIHNAAFDTGFLDMELGRCGRGKISDYCQVIDTVKLAKKLLPGRAVSLDSLSRYYEIDNSNRTLHGALLDAELLAEVYLSLSRGQDTLTLVNEDIDNLPPMPAFDASIVIKASPKSSLNTDAFWILQKRKPRQRLPGAKRLNPPKRATQQRAHKKINRKSSRKSRRRFRESLRFLQVFFVDILIFAVDAPRAFFQRIFTQTTRYKGFGKCACFFMPRRDLQGVQSSSS